MFEPFGIIIAPPPVVRRAFRRAALLTHPDKVDKDAVGMGEDEIAAAFRRVREAFEVLYDAGKQEEYREGLTREDGKEPQLKKRKKTTTEKTHTSPKTESWEDVLSRLNHLRDLEASFKKSLTDKNIVKRRQIMLRRLQIICRNLDERSGCPPKEVFVNGLWGGLIESEVMKEYRLGSDWVVIREEGKDGGPEGRLVFRERASGEMFDEHPNEKAEAILSRAREAIASNTSKPGDDEELIREILDYLHEDHECNDYDEEVEEMEKEIEEICK